jgi:hypothetical protein
VGVADPGPAADEGAGDPGATDPGAVDPGVADPGPAGDEGPADTGPATPPAGQPGGPCLGDTCNGAPLWNCLDPGTGAACTMACLENAECPPGLRCEAFNDGQYCVFGPRGTGGIGDPCGEGKGNGCASGLCIDADPVEGIPVDSCTAACTGDGDCAAPFPTCLGGFANVCVPVLSAWMGGLCGTVEPKCEPDQGTCTDLGADGERCTKACAADEECGADWLECRAAGDGTYCLVKLAG